MSEDLAQMSIEEMRVKLASLESERGNKPKFLAMIADASTEEEALNLYRQHKQQLGDLRDLDLQIHALKKAIAAEELMDDEMERTLLLAKDRETLESAAEAVEELVSTIYNQLSDTYSPTELQKKLDSLRQLAAKLRDMKDEMEELSNG